MVPQTLYNSKKRWPDFAATVDGITEECFEDMEATAYERAMAGSDTLLKFLLASGNPQKYAQRSIQEGTVVNVHSHEHRVAIVEDDGWYGNVITNDQAAQAPAPSIAGPVVSGAVQGGGMRQTLGQDGDGTDGDD